MLSLAHRVLKRLNDSRFLLAPLLVFSMVLQSCTSAPIKRRGSGNRYHRKAPKQGPFYSPIKKRVVILPLTNESLMGKKDLSVMATEELRMELSKSNEFVIDNKNAAEFGTSKEVYSGGGIKLAQTVRKGKLLGVNLIVFGRITNARVRQKSDEIGFIRKTMAYSEVEVEIRVFDVNSSKEIFKQKEKGVLSDGSYRFFMAEAEENLEYRQNLMRYGTRVAVRKVVPAIHKLGAKLDWSGRVAKIIGTKVYVNAGRRSGINIGDILKVVTEGKEIFDPESGALLGVSKGEIKGTLEVIDYFGPDGAVSILHSGGSVNEGDFIQLY